MLCEILRLDHAHLCFALGLGLVASEVCIPLIKDACAHRIYKVLRDHDNCDCSVATTEGNKARSVFGRKLDREDGRSDPREACWKAHQRLTCVCGRPRAILGVTLLKV